MASIDRLPSGLYRARWRTRPGETQKSRTFDRKGQAQAFLDKTMGDLQRDAYVDPAAGRVTFRDHAERWRSIQHHRPSTRAQIESSLTRHVYPVFGDVAIADVRPSDIQAWLAGIHLEPATIETVYRFVAAIFRAAVEDRLIASSPCTRSVRRPKIEKGPVTIPTTDQVHAIADRVPDRYRAMILLAAGSGLRQGELFGLGIDHVDFLRREVQVERQLTLVKGPPVLAPPNTAASRRTVPLADVILTVMAAHLERYPVTHPDGLLFTAPRGGPIRRNRWSGDVWLPAIDGLELPPRTGMHALRHYFASLLIRHGESVTVVQHRLGHASATETLDTYAHLWPDSADQTRAAIAAELGSADAAESWLSHGQ